MKKGLQIIGLLCTLTLLTVLTWLAKLDLNYYQTEIQNWVQQTTGRPLHLKGNLELHLFPWLGLNTGPFTLGNPPHLAPSPPLLQVANAQIRISLWPFLLKQIKIEHFQLTGVILHLVRQTDGSNNWDPLFPSPTSASPSYFSLEDLTLNHLIIQDSQVTWTDQLLDQQFNLHHFSLNTGPLRLGQSTQIVLNTQLTWQQWQVQLNFNTLLHNFPQHTLYHLSDFTLTTELLNTPFPLPHPWKLQGDLKLNFAQSTFQLTEFNLQFPTAQIAGHLHWQSRSQLPSISGHLQVQTQALSSLFPFPTFSKSLNLITDLQSNFKILTLNNFSLQLDEHHLTVPRIEWHLTQDFLTVPNFNLHSLGNQLLGQFTLQHPFTIPHFTAQLQWLSSPQALLSLAATLPFSQQLPKQFSIKTGLGMANLPGLSNPETALLRMETQVDFAKNILQFKEFNLNVEGQTLTIPNLTINFDRSNLKIDSYTLNWLGIHLNGQLTGQQFSTNPQLTGQWRLAPVNLSILERITGLTLPQQLPAFLVINPLSLQGKFHFQNGQLSLLHPQIQLGNWQLSVSQGEFNFQQDKLNLSGFKLAGPGLTLLGQGKVQGMFERPSWQGLLELQPCDLQAVFREIGYPISWQLPLSLNFKTEIRGQGLEWKFDNLVMHLNDSTVKGEIHGDLAQPLDLNFQLAMDKWQMASNSLDKSDRSLGLTSSGISLPIKELQALRINGEVKIGELKLSILTMKEVRLQLLTEHGRLKISPKLR